jgi:hypothetical protein
MEVQVSDPAPAPETYYYVRVTQVDGELAWSSPIWVKFTGEPVREEPRPAWNEEEAWTPPADPPAEDHTAALLAHLAEREGAEKREFRDLRQARIVEHPKGRYALFHGHMGKDNQRVHIRWYVGFDDPRIVIAPGWRDFGMRRY